MRQRPHDAQQPAHVTAHPTTPTPQPTAQPTAQPAHRQPTPHRQPRQARQPPQPRQPPHPRHASCTRLPAFSLSKRWKVARLTSAISSSSSVIAWPVPRCGNCCRSGVGTADADAPPASENVNPAAPNAGTATLVTRFFPLEVFFACRMVDPPSIARSIPAAVSLRPGNNAGNNYAHKSAALHVRDVFIFMNGNQHGRLTQRVNDPRSRCECNLVQCRNRFQV